MTEQEVVNLMKSSKNKEEWNKNCDRVKQLVKTNVITDRSGDYPTYWNNRIILAGVYSQLSVNWEFNFYP